MILVGGGGIGILLSVGKLSFSEQERFISEILKMSMEYFIFNIVNPFLAG